MGLEKSLTRGTFLNEHIDLDEQKLDDHEWQSTPLLSFEWPRLLWQFDLDTNSPDQVVSDTTTYLDTGQQQNIDDIDSVTTTCLSKTSSPRIVQSNILGYQQILR